MIRPLRRMSDEELTATMRRLDALRNGVYIPRPHPAERDATRQPDAKRRTLDRQQERRLKYSGV